MGQDTALIRRAAFAGVLLAWFLYFTWDSASVRFSADDMMNLAAYWHPSPWRLLYSPFLLWRDFYRPMGGLFYWPLFWKFGLNPWPFHAALLALLLLNVALLYRLARLLGATELTAWLAAMIAAYQPGLVNLYWDTAHVYDALCWLFFEASLICYVRARSQGRRLSGGETAAFFGLFLCALNSKEMALTLPAVLLAYEQFYRRGDRLWRVPLAAAALALVAVWGRVLIGLMQQPAYTPAPSWSRLVEFQQGAWRSLLLSNSIPGPVWTILIWLTVTYVAFRRERPILRFCWAILVITPLPVEFLKGRGEAVLAVPLIGWAIFAAVVFVDLAGNAADVLNAEPLLRRFHRNYILAGIVGAALLAIGQRNSELKTAGQAERLDNGLLTADVIDQFRALRPRVRPHSAVVFLNDPFPAFDMAFIAELWFRDRTVTVKLQRITPLSAAELAGADYLFDYRNGKLLLVRGQP